jgi:lipoate-protein ligase B
VSEHLGIEWLGSVPYAAALERQLAALEERRRGGPDRLLLLEHPPVITLGRSARPEHLLRSRAELAARGVELFEAARGGDVTWHGPGQLVGYPILDLEARGRDVHCYLRELEGVLIDALADLGIAARRREGFAGVWLDERRKIASIGVGVRQWLTIHGFALNVCCNLARFDAIIPCGLAGVEMVSASSVLGTHVPLERAAERVEARLRAVFGQ